MMGSLWAGRTNHNHGSRTVDPLKQVGVEEQTHNRGGLSSPVLRA
jgi:hypothetical protein